LRGHVRKRGNKWCFVIDVGRDEQGKRKQKWFSGFATKKEAERALAAKLQELNNGLLSTSDMTVGKLLEDWLLDKQFHVKPTTFELYSRIVTIHIAPMIGHLTLSDLRPDHIQNMYRMLQQKTPPLQAKTIRTIHSILRNALKRALKWGLIPRDPSEAVELPRSPRRTLAIWTPEQIRTFLAVNQDIDSRYYTIFVLAIYTGMRKGEILALRWSDIDFERDIIQVTRTFSWVDGEAMFLEAKTHHSNRSIAISHDVKVQLLRHREFQEQEKRLYADSYHDGNLVVARPDGEPIRLSSLQKQWRHAVKRAGLPEIRFHDLRHTHASLLLLQGVHPKIVSERLGHSNISITMDTYSHVLPSLHREVAEDFARLISNKNIS